ncbi:hypothetical protein DPMN_044206 [Dreissena polymorpha]|uniref:Uncharacterized protein n=1 Tax=Dreissena polymorpha TaxID=45954 RepID=A0A9D4D5E2_DREPO|nr:hypothetical protein DPMN_044206 [Dreissena polymorpha]
MIGGDRLYIINRDQHKLLTLARDGTLLATYTDRALRGPESRVLVCVWGSNTVLQLATLATQEDGCVHSLLSQDNDAQDVVGKDDLTTQKSVQGLNAWTKCMCVKCGTKCMCSVQGLNAWTKCMCSVHGLNAWTKCMCVKCGTKCMYSVQGLNAWTKCMCSVQGTKCMCIKCGTKCMCVKCVTKCMCSVQGLNAFELSVSQSSVSQYGIELSVHLSVCLSVVGP